MKALTILSGLSALIGLLALAGGGVIAVAAAVAGMSWKNPGSQLALALICFGVAFLGLGCWGL